MATWSKGLADELLEDTHAEVRSSHEPALLSREDERAFRDRKHVGLRLGKDAYEAHGQLYDPRAAGLGGAQLEVAGEAAGYSRGAAFEIDVAPLEGGSFPETSAGVRERSD